MQVIRAAAVVLCFSLLTACATADDFRLGVPPDDVVVTAPTTASLPRAALAAARHPAMSGEQNAYAQLFPSYAELCALSEIRKHPGFGADIRSGPGGHLVLYLQGACREAEANYPVLRLCGPADQDPETGEAGGVGISGNAHFANASWVAVPGRRFFHQGTLRPGDRLDRAAYRRTQAEARRLGVLDGIRFHADAFEGMPPDAQPADWMYELSVSTDYATGFGRGRYCTRVPLTRQQLVRAVDFLNAENAPYRAGTRVFQWNVLRDNCAHLLHNALAAAGVWDQWPTRQFILWAALSFPVPKNEFVNLARRTNDLPLDDLGALYDDPAARLLLLREGRLPTAPGALASAEPPWQANDLYQASQLRLIFYDEPNVGPYKGRLRAIQTEPRYTDLRANLSHFAGQYARAWAVRRPLDWWLARRPVAERESFAAFYARFYEHAGQQAAWVETRIAALDGNAVPPRAARYAFWAGNAPAPWPDRPRH